MFNNCIGTTDVDPEQPDVKESPIASFGRDIVTLAKHPTYVFAVLGSTLYTGGIPHVLSTC